MVGLLAIALLVSLCVLPNSSSFGQGIGEYGRAVGSIPHGPGVTGVRTPSGGGEGGPVDSGVGNVGGRALPTRLIVTAKSTGLYPTQDGEAQMIERLVEGESLVPMVQAAGGNDWYMVKTAKGAIGWVKGSDVREEKVTKVEKSK